MRQRMRIRGISEGFKAAFSWNESTARIDRQMLPEAAISLTSGCRQSERLGALSMDSRATCRAIAEFDTTGPCDLGGDGLLNLAASDLSQESQLGLLVSKCRGCAEYFCAGDRETGKAFRLRRFL